MSGITDKVKEGFKAVSGHVDKIAEQYPKTFFAVLLIGGVGVILGAAMSYTGPMTGGNLSTLSFGIDKAMPMVLTGSIILGAPAIYVLFNEKDEKSKKYQCAQIIASTAVIVAAFFLGASFVGKGIGNMALDPFRGGIDLKFTKIIFPAEWNIAAISSFVGYATAGGVGLLQEMTKNSKHKWVAAACMHLLTAAASIAFVTAIIFANFHGKGADPMMAITAPTFGLSVAGVGIAALVFARSVCRLFHLDYSYQKKIDDNRKDQKRHEAGVRDMAHAAEQRAELEEEMNVAAQQRRGRKWWPWNWGKRREEEEMGMEMSDMAGERRSWYNPTGSSIPPVD